jgi:hypothetical protein
MVSTIGTCSPGSPVRHTTAGKASEFGLQISDSLGQVGAQSARSAPERRLGEEGDQVRLAGADTGRRGSEPGVRVRNGAGQHARMPLPGSVDRTQPPSAYARSPSRLSITATSRTAVPSDEPGVDTDVVVCTFLDGDAVEALVAQPGAEAAVPVAVVCRTACCGLAGCNGAQPTRRPPRRRPPAPAPPTRSGHANQAGRRGCTRRNGSGSARRTGRRPPHGWGPRRTPRRDRARWRCRTPRCRRGSPSPRRCRASGSSCRLLSARGPRGPGR